jgi:hypothetical protein
MLRSCGFSFNPVSGLAVLEPGALSHFKFWGCRTMRTLLCISVVCVSALAAGCAEQSTSPASPSGTSVAKVNAAPDGSTLKVTAPVPQAPVNSTRLTFGAPVTLTVGNASPLYTTAIALTYRFEVYSANGVRVYASPPVNAGPATTSHVVTATLDTDQTFTWQARAEYQGNVGPWSPRATFVTAALEGYIRPNELFDPLTNGKTVGTIGGSGNVTWVPNQGIRMNDELAYVVYQLPQVFSSGEMSVEVTGLGPNGAPGKARIFSILDRLGVMSSSAKYSINVQYRGAGGAPDNCVAWKAVLGDNANSVEPDTNERYGSVVILDPSKLYLWQAFWTPTSVRVVVRDGGATGAAVYDHTEIASSGTTNWNPAVMYAFLGTNNATYAGFDGTRIGMTLRNLWVGSAPRPTTIP